MHRLISILAILLLLAACSTVRFPGVHRITIQQGNVVTQQMIDEIRPGMTKRQVLFVMGNPIIDDSLDNERWDYIYTIQLAGGPVFQRVLSLYFVEGTLSYFEGHFLPTEALEDLRGESVSTTEDADAENDAEQETETEIDEETVAAAEDGS